MKNNKFLLLFSLVLLLLLCVSAVSAVEVDGSQINGTLSSDLEKNIDFVFESDSCSSLKNCLGDSENGESLDDVSGSNDAGSDGEDSTGDYVSSSNSSEVDGEDSTGSVSSSNSSEVDDGYDWVRNLTNKSDYVFVVNSDNFYTFFEDDNVLKSIYGGCILVFEGNFSDMGVIVIGEDNTLLTARDSLFYNTPFYLDASNVSLSNVNMVLDKSFSDNEYAGILIRGDNVTVYNVTLDYTTPTGETGLGIYSAGDIYGNSYEGLRLINNSIRFTGNIDAMYNYGVVLVSTYDSLIYGNDINCSLPLKNVYYGLSGDYGPISMDTVAGMGFSYCDGLVLSNNLISTYANARAGGYPTLDTIIMYGCSYSVIENNTIISEDFATKLGENNYLYGIDMWSLNDVTVVYNTIDMKTIGGQPGMGTAYPIQINGPVYNTKVAFNNLTTFNNGPNCGIYSQNYYGDTYIDIISNFINVTGNASANAQFGKAWSLVTGIEVQDTHDNILNNTIIVNNLADYSSNDNVYGISYAQNINSDHVYNIQYNNVTTNGNYGVKLLGSGNSSVKSNVTNNVINTVTTSKDADGSTNRQVSTAGGTTVRNNTNGVFKNNMSDDYYPDWLKDYLSSDNTRVSDDFNWIAGAVANGSNGSGFAKSVGNGSGVSGSGESGGVNSGGSTSGGTSSTGNNSESGAVFGDNSTNNAAGVVDGDSNSTVSAPGVSGAGLASLSAASPSDSGSSARSPDSYELNEKDSAIKSADILPLAVIVLIAFLLLILGYKRERDRFKEE